MADLADEEHDEEHTDDAEGAEASTAQGAENASADATVDASVDAAGSKARPASVGVSPTRSPTPEALAAFAEVVRFLRSLADSRALPGGVGSFDVLYINDVEIVLWLTPGREGQRLGEHAVPTSCLETVWEVLRAATFLDEPTVADLVGSRGHGRWLLALLGALPGVRLDEEALTLRYGAAAVEAAPVTVPLGDARIAPPTLS